jgi:hypothetical protein
MIGASDVGSVTPLVKEGDVVTKVRVCTWKGVLALHAAAADRQLQVATARTELRTCTAVLCAVLFVQLVMPAADS